MDSMPNGNTVDTQPNDVWSTINKGIDAIVAFKNASGKNSQTQSSPTGTGGGTIWNPFPGTSSAFPQAQGKVSFGAVNVGGFGLILAIVAVVLGVLFLARR